MKLALAAATDDRGRLPVVRELLHELLPAAARAEVRLVESSDVLDDFFSLHALSQRHVLSDVGCDL